MITALPGEPARSDSVSAVFVLPGQLRVASEPTAYTTILGSCVTVCLFDLGAAVGGLNHYLLPGWPPRTGPDPLRWSGPAIDRLVDELVRAGARPSALEAKVFGGAQIGARSSLPELRIGERNVAVALATLESRGIPVSARAVGGASGRKVVFESHSGLAWVKDLSRAER